MTHVQIIGKVREFMNLYGVYEDEGTGENRPDSYNELAIVTLTNLKLAAYVVFSKPGKYIEDAWNEIKLDVQAGECAFGNLRADIINYETRNALTTIAERWIQGHAKAWEAQLKDKGLYDFAHVLSECETVQLMGDALRRYHDIFANALADRIRRMDVARRKAETVGLASERRRQAIA